MRMLSKKKGLLVLYDVINATQSLSRQKHVYNINVTCSLFPMWHMRRSGEFDPLCLGYLPEVWTTHFVSHEVILPVYD